MESAQRRICLNFYLFTSAFYTFELYCSFQVRMSDTELSQVNIVYNERSRNISLAPITWPNLTFLPERKWRVSFVYTFQRRNKTTPLVTLLLIPNEFGKSIWIARSKIRNIRRTRNTIFAGTRKAGARNNFAQHVIPHSRSKGLASHSVCPPFPVSLSLQSALET